MHRPVVTTKLPFGLLSIVGMLLAVATIYAGAQAMPNTLTFSSAGSFSNGVAESSSSVLYTDNNLTNGYNTGFDLTDAPATMNPTGSAGSAAFQWGTASSTSNYSHASALWFEGATVSNATANQVFNFGSLYYRNGTIKSTTGASAVDLTLNLNFINPSGISQIAINFTSSLVNTTNTTDPVASADYVSLNNWYAPVNFTDSSGKQYYFELSFTVDNNTIDGTLSTPDEFHVFEGQTGRAELLGQFTTSPRARGFQVPEPSTAMLSLIGALALLRRKR